LPEASSRASISTSRPAPPRLKRSSSEMLARLEASGNLKRIADTLPRLLDRMEMLDAMLHAFETSCATTAKEPKSPGGFGGIWGLMRQPENQDALRFLINVGKAMCAAGQKAKAP